MRQSRRWFLHTIGAGAAMVSLPEVSSILGLIGFPGGARGGVDPTIESLLLGRAGGGPFVAHAETYVTEGTPQQLLSAPSALLSMLDELEVGRSFSDRVNYYDASQCRGNFQAQEAAWRSNFGAYTDVKRAPADRDVAIMAAGNIDSGRTLLNAEGATQYRDLPAVALAGDDPGVLLAARSLLAGSHTPSKKEAAQGLSVVEKQLVRVEGGQTATRYETPTSSILHVPRPRRQERFGRRSRGVVFAHNKQDRRNPNQIYYAGLYV